MTPNDLKIFQTGYEKRWELRDKELLTQAHYIYEAVGTVLHNAFSKGKIKMRSKTYSQEAMEQFEPTEEMERINGLRIMKNLEMSMAAFNANKANERLKQDEV